MSSHSPDQDRGPSTLKSVRIVNMGGLRDMPLGALITLCPSISVSRDSLGDLWVAKSSTPNPIDFSTDLFARQYLVSVHHLSKSLPRVIISPENRHLQDSIGSPNTQIILDPDPSEQRVQMTLLQHAKGGDVWSLSQAQDVIGHCIDGVAMISAFLPLKTQNVRKISSLAYDLNPFNTNTDKIKLGYQEILDFNSIRQRIADYSAGHVNPYAIIGADGKITGESVNAFFNPQLSRLPVLPSSQLNYMYQVFTLAQGKVVYDERLQ